MSIKYFLAVFLLYLLSLIPYNLISSKINRSEYFILELCFFLVLVGVNFFLQIQKTVLGEEVPPLTMEPEMLLYCILAFFISIIFSVSPNFDRWEMKGKYRFLPPLCEGMMGAMIFIQLRTLILL